MCVAAPALSATHSPIRSAPALAGRRRGSPGFSSLRLTVQEVVLATHQDAFFAETQYANFGETAEHINAALSEFRVSDGADCEARAVQSTRWISHARTAQSSHSVRWSVGRTRPAHSAALARLTY